jgi:hypothetical protein
MGPWGFVSLAYGIVWGLLLLYTISLRRRYHRAQAGLAALSQVEVSDHDGKK